MDIKLGTDDDLSTSTKDIVSNSAPIIANLPLEGMNGCEPTQSENI
jgi:hypothetical protein